MRAPRLARPVTPRPGATRPAVAACASAKKRPPPPERQPPPPDGANADTDDDAAWQAWLDVDAPPLPATPPPRADAASGDRLRAFAEALAGGPDVSAEAEAAAAAAARAEGDAERAFLVAVGPSGPAKSAGVYATDDSLTELAALCETAGLEVVGRTYQPLASPHPRTYVGSGFLATLTAAAVAAGADAVVVDDELTPSQQRALDAALEPAGLRVVDRTALVLDVFAQRARSREGALQVELAASQFQLPRLTRLWTHLERQGGGRSKGMGETQKEVDKRLLRARIAALRDDIEDVRRDRAAARARRAAAGLPVVALVGYTSAGKSSLLNALTGAGALADAALFATLDPLTRRVALPSGKAALLTDTVGFIRKLPPTLVAAFRATLEEVAAADVLLHVVDVAHPAAAAQSATVAAALDEVLGGDGDEALPRPPLVTVWNKVDAAADPAAVRAVAAARTAPTIPVSAHTGDGLEALLAAVEAAVAGALVPVTALVPFDAGALAAAARSDGVVAAEAYLPSGTLLRARVPPGLAARLAPHAVSEDEWEEAVAREGVVVEES